MGIGFVLIFWGVLGLIGATIGSAILRQIASDFTQGRVRSSPQLRAIRLFPFACIVWAAGVFISYAVINEVAFDRDAAIGDGWTCPLPNGYAIQMIDVSDHGSIYTPRTHMKMGIGRVTAVANICMLQVAGPRILGRALCRSNGIQVTEDHDAVLPYFILDTATGTQVNFYTYDDLRAAAAPMNVQVHLEPIDVVYGRYRFTWFDGLAAALFFGGPLMGAWMLFRHLLRMRKSGDMHLEPA